MSFNKAASKELLRAGLISSGTLLWLILLLGAVAEITNPPYYKPVTEAVPYFLIVAGIPAIILAWTHRSNPLYGCDIIRAEELPLSRNKNDVKISLIEIGKLARKINAPIFYIENYTHVLYMYSIPQEGVPSGKSIYAIWYNSAWVVAQTEAKKEQKAEKKEEKKGGE